MRLAREHAYYVSAALLAVGLVCLITGLLLEGHRPLALPGLTLNIKELHSMSGHLATALVALHLVLHAGWIRSAVRDLLQRRRTLIAVVLVILASLLSCYLLSAGDSSSGPPSFDRWVRTWCYLPTLNLVHLSATEGSVADHLPAGYRV